MAEKMLKWHAEAIGRCVELTAPQEVLKHTFTLLEVLAEVIGTSYLEVALETSTTALANADQQTQPPLQPLQVLRSVDLICHLWQQYVTDAIFPLASTSVTMDEIDSADPRFYDILNGHLAKLREDHQTLTKRLIRLEELHDESVARGAAVREGLKNNLDKIQRLRAELKAEVATANEISSTLDKLREARTEVHQIIIRELSNGVECKLCLDIYVLPYRCANSSRTTTPAFGGSPVVIAWIATTYGVDLA
ncbi:exocyst complex component Sec10-domain-containing protein [Thelephora terrestris]|uniref:Exocyst complex component Sec10-domain-containing protein n=1 Tax=Thelephora terrestris TaxID=56493 RepID=A0A9P6HDF9_9AGAM|nr:exocyst complex component Sec10-domain-containing protein [Thelephora terrestris]